MRTGRNYIAGTLGGEAALDRIDRCCSLYYLMSGGAFNAAQSAMVDAVEVLRQHPNLYGHGVKGSVKKAMRCYDQWNARIKDTMGDRYVLWLDVTDKVDAEIRPKVETMYWSINATMLKADIPQHELMARMETALAMTEAAEFCNRELFKYFRKEIGLDISNMFIGGDFKGVRRWWQDACDNLRKRLTPGIVIDLNADKNCSLAMEIIMKRLMDMDMYNRAGRYGLRLNPDTWGYLSDEDRQMFEREQDNDTT